MKRRSSPLIEEDTDPMTIYVSSGTDTDTDTDSDTPTHTHTHTGIDTDDDVVSCPDEDEEEYAQMPQRCVRSKIGAALLDMSDSDDSCDTSPAEIPRTHTHKHRGSPDLSLGPEGYVEPIGRGGRRRRDSGSETDVPESMQCALHAAVRCNNEEIVRHMLEADGPLEINEQPQRAPKIRKRQVKTEVLNEALVDIRDIKGNTALHMAAAYGKVEIVKLLVDAGTNLEARNSKGSTPLHLAIKRQRVPIVEYLLDQGADCDSKQYSYSHWTSILSSIISKFDTDTIAELLLKHGADINTSCVSDSAPIYEAAEKNNYNLVRKIMEAGYDLNGDNTESYDTTLHFAAAQCNETLIKAFIDAGADLDFKDVMLEGDGALLITADETDAYGCVRRLCEAGARVNCRNGEYMTPLHKAASRNDLEMVKVLVSHGADLNARQIEGMTPLCLALQYGALCVVEWLFEKVNTNVNATDEAGYGPLFFHPEYWKQCWARGGIFTYMAPDIGGLLHWAAEIKDTAIAKKALAYGAHVNCVNKEKSESPLHIAAKHGAHHIVSMLVAAGANLELLDKDGRSALRVAIDNNKPEATTALLVGGATPNSLFRFRVDLAHPMLTLAELASDAQLMRSFVESGIYIDDTIASICCKQNKANVRYNRQIRTLLLNNQNIF